MKPVVCVEVSRRLAPATEASIRFCGLIRDRILSHGDSLLSCPAGGAVASVPGGASLSHGDSVAYSARLGAVGRENS